MSVKVPIIAGLTDINALQNFMMLVLADDPRLANTPVVQEVKFVIDSNLAIDMIWQQPRSAFVLNPTGYEVVSGATGPVGAGLMIEMPEYTTDSPAVRGSPATWDISVIAFEERNINLLPGTGTGITVEQYGELIVDILQLLSTYTYGTLKVKTATVRPARDWMDRIPGIAATRTSFEATVGRPQSTRTAPALATFSGGNCTITCTDGAANIYYTTDGSAPVASNTAQDNPAGVGATLYTAPFAVTSGTLVLTAARNPNAGYILGPINGFNAP